jgi:hypothetical protein
LYTIESPSGQLDVAALHARLTAQVPSVALVADVTPEKTGLRVHVPVAVALAQLLAGPSQGASVFT